MAQTFIVRDATLADRALLVRHRRLMFDEMAQAEGDRLDAAEMDEMERMYADFIDRHLPGGSLHAWVALAGDEAAASGAISLLDWPPGVRNPAHQIGMLHSVYTEPAYRHTGMARAVVQRAVQFCRERGIHRVTLAASQAGRPLYESLGFQGVDNEMRLVLP